MRIDPRWVATVTAAAIFFFVQGEVHAATDADRSALWKLIELKCLRHLAKAEAPIPCDNVDVSHGWDNGVAFVKDRSGPGQMLAVPTQEIVGIEDPALLEAGAPNYFALARRGRVNVGFHLGRRLAPELVAIVVNAKPNRTQDQLHLRLDCLEPTTLATLRASATEIGFEWAPLAAPLRGRIYMARRIAAADVAGASPFRLLAEGVAGARANIANWSIATIDAAAVNATGEIVLAIESDRDAGDAEALEDHSCAISHTSR